VGTNTNFIALFFCYVAVALLWFVKIPVDAAAFVFNRADAWLDKQLTFFFEDK